MNNVSTQTLSKILICDDHPVSQLGVQCALEDIFPETSFTFTKVGLGHEAVKFIKENPVDLLILDLRLPDISGIEVLKALQSESRQTKTLVLTGEENVHVLTQLLRYNVSAVLLKSYTLPMLETAILYVQKNSSAQTYLDPALETQLKTSANKQLLSPREFEVLELLLKGHTNKAIAEQLKCSPETVKVHRTKIREKTNLKSRDEISAWFYKGMEK